MSNNCAYAHVTSTALHTITRSIFTPIGVVTEIGKITGHGGHGDHQGYAREKAAHQRVFVNANLAALTRSTTVALTNFALTMILVSVPSCSPLSRLLCHTRTRELSLSPPVYVLSVVSSHTQSLIPLHRNHVHLFPCKSNVVFFCPAMSTRWS